MTTILNPTPVNPQLLPASYNNLAHSNILPAKKIVRTASSNDTNHAHVFQHQNYPKNLETLVTKTTLTLPPNKIAVSNIITPNICAATFDGSGAFPPSPFHTPIATAAARSNDPRTDKSWPPISLASGRLVNCKPSSAVNCLCPVWPTLAEAAANR